MPLPLVAPKCAEPVQDAPNRELTVSCNTFNPAGVASRIATKPTAKMPAASLKSRLKASTIEAIAKPSAIRLIATLRPVSPALLAADSNEAPPSLAAINVWIVCTMCIGDSFGVVGSEFELALHFPEALGSELAVGIRLDGRYLPATGSRDDVKFIGERVLGPTLV